MSSLSVSARGADSDSTREKRKNQGHKFLWKWYLSDLDTIEKNGLKVFSCFSCGGGSSMGYKLAGYEVVGNCEIDPEVMNVYKHNHHPKYPYLMDVRDFLNIPDDELPAELFDLDILDGSPPCSVFSMSGDREAAWNKEKVFKEGQAKQKLDDLFFYFIDIARKLQPKAVIAENVTGLLKGNAKGYVNEIIKAFDYAGYRVQLFRLKAMYMGVPQKRERVFFIASRKDLKMPKLKLQFNEKPILFGEVRSKKGVPVNHDTVTYDFLRQRIKTDTSLGDISLRVRGTWQMFNMMITWDDAVAYTLTSSSAHYRGYDGMAYSDEDMRNVASFPQDYDFMGQDVKFYTGMSVPPVMMAQIAAEIKRQWFK